MPETPVFQTEDSLWHTLEDGTRTFDMRRWDLSDERIYALSWFVPDPDAERPWTMLAGYEPVRHQGQRAAGFTPEQSEVSFRNKATGAVLTFKYRGVEFMNWAPAWGFLLLGERVPMETPEEEATDA